MSDPRSGMAMLEGGADVYKGTRDYVHATDMIPALDTFPIRHLGGGHLARVEFHAPLRHAGLVMFGHSAEAIDRAAISATGQFASPQGVTEFVVAASPLLVTRRRAFEESAIMQASSYEADPRSCEVAADGVHSVMELASTCMKRVCGEAAPGMRRWWFVRMTKNEPLPPNCSQVRVTLKALTLGRFATAELLVDAGFKASINFVGEPS